MPLSIKAPEADRLARQLAEVTGETITDALIVAMRERLIREQRKRGDSSALLDEIRAIGRHCAALPALDSRSDDEILGYDENGIPS
jgi:antitoxin VapB